MRWKLYSSLALLIRNQVLKRKAKENTHILILTLKSTLSLIMILQHFHAGYKHALYKNRKLYTTEGKKQK
jgi:hypothetical protein